MGFLIEQIPVRPLFLSYLTAWARGASHVDGLERQDHLGQALRDPAGQHQGHGGPGDQGRGAPATGRQGHGQL